MQNYRPKSLTPAYDQQQWEWKVGAVEKCGRNQGPHDYIPIEWVEKIDPENETNTKAVRKLMCRICLHRLAMETVEQFYPLNSL